MPGCGALLWCGKAGWCAGTFIDDPGLSDAVSAWLLAAAPSAIIAGAAARTATAARRRVQLMEGVAAFCVVFMT